MRVRRSHGLVVTGTFIDGDDPETVIVVMDMDDIGRARAFAASPELASVAQAGWCLDPPDGVWFGPTPVG